MTTTPADPTLAAEQEHLAASRDALRRMHDTAADWENATAGDHVSTQYLRQQLYRRKLELQDDPDVPLFFGRLDYAAALGAELDETLYIGRRHVTGELGGDPLVIDWRAPMSLPFYRASALDPMGVQRRRRFGFQGGALTAYEDEQLGSGEQGDSSILQNEIERPRTGPMRDIVATIQPDQDVLVRTPLEQSLCIQGAPGTGKTAVGLHRAAFLLYAYREQLKRSGVLVIGPNDSFLSYIGDVLPALGEIDATQETLRSLVEKDTGARVKSEDAPEIAVLKGDARLADVLGRAIWASITPATEPLVVPLGARIWRVPAAFINEAVERLRARGVRYDAGRHMLPQQLAHQVLLRMEAAGDSPDDRVQNAVARTSAVKSYAKQVWPELTARGMVFRLLSDPAYLARCADGILTEAEQERLLWPAPPRSAGSAKWTLSDVVLIDEARDLLARTASLGHVIVDEAQDLSAMQLRAVGRRASTGSVTLLGDLAQATTPWAATSWAQSLAALGKEEATIHELVEGFRVPASVIDYAARLLPVIAPGLTPPHSVRRSAGDLERRRVRNAVRELAGVAQELSTRPGTTGLIVPDALVRKAAKALASAGVEASVLGTPDAARASLELVPASLAKGLEFDHVCLLEPAAIVAGEHDRTTGLRRLYVCLTRAVSSLIVLHCEPLPDELDEI